MRRAGADHCQRDLLSQQTGSSLVKRRDRVRSEARSADGADCPCARPFSRVATDTDYDECRWIGAARGGLASEAIGGSDWIRLLPRPLSGPRSLYRRHDEKCQERAHGHDDVHD